MMYLCQFGQNLVDKAMNLVTLKIGSRDRVLKRHSCRTLVTLKIRPR